MSQTAVSALLFDLDGTLIDSAPDLAAAANAVRTQHGLPALPLAAYRSAASAGAQGLLAVAMQLTPQDARFAPCRALFLQHYEQHLLQHTRLFEGVEALLQACRARALRWGVVTNKARRYAQPLMQALLPAASVLVAGDDTAHPKPHPAPLLAAAQKLGAEPARCIYVGDDLRDIQAAQAAGMLPVAAAWGYLGQSAPHTWGAHAIAQQPADLLPLL